jgi:hypothetical protein
VIARRGDHLGAPALVEEEVGKKADHAQQRQRDVGSQNADADREHRDRDDAGCGREVT